MRLKVPYRVIAACAALATAVGCSTKKAPEPTSTLSGTLTCKGDAKVSDGAVVYVRLSDITQGQISGTTVVEQQLRPTGDVSIPFELSYKDKWINPSHQYLVEARVVEKGKLQFISNEKLSGMTGGLNVVAMELERPGRK